MATKIVEMERIGLGGAFSYEGTATNDGVIVKFPITTKSKSYVQDVAWQTNGDDVFATISSVPAANSLWDSVDSDSYLNRAVTGLKFVGTGKFAVRVVFNDGGC